MDDSNIPIDINIGKLQSWLISRRHVPKEWQKNIIEVREKINNAIQDMPAHEYIAALVSGSYINYFHCLKIIDILKETEADTKNLFGRYGSRRMKDWQDIVRSYEKDNLYLAEAAQILVRNITYEIPGIKKQIAKQDQLQSECDKKYSDYLKSEASSRSEFLTLCRQLGIKGQQIKRELVERVQELPEIYDKIGKSLTPLEPAIALYSAFTQYILGSQAAELLPLLQHVARRGNTTRYEWRRGQPPARVQPDDDAQGAGDQIDFGDDAGAAAEIDFGDGDAGAEIDWGIEDASIEHAGIEDEGITDARIELASHGAGGADDADDGVARGADALGVLDSADTRSQFLDQLLELESFLKMRLYETNAANESHTFSLIEQLPAESAAALGAMLRAVQAATAALLAPEVAHLHNVKHSPRYVDVLAGQLQQKLALCEKAARGAAREAERRELGAARGAELRPLLARMLQRSQDLQADIEQDISRKYKGRPVHVIGGVRFL